MLSAAQSTSWSDPVLWLGVSLLLTHELDAVRAREWRLLFVLRRMRDEKARDVFIAIHVPIVTALLWLLANPTPEIRVISQVAFDAFLIIHAGLHRRLEGHPLYDFHGRLSRGLIYSGAGVGALHLALLAANMFQHA